MNQNLEFRFAKANFATPLLNVPSYEEVFLLYSLPVEAKTKLLRAVEAIALPGTKFNILSLEGNSIKVTTTEYPGEFWIDRRFVTLHAEEPSERKKKIPAKETMLQFLKSLICKNILYVWGGNYHRGIDQLIEFFPPSKELNKEEYEFKLRKLEGLDCSGLLFEATDGFTPRNTSELVQDKFAKNLPIEGLKASEISAILEPLDILVWKGHMVIVLDKNTIIESRYPSGVITTNIIKRIDEILLTKKPSNSNKGEEFFVAKRWC